MKRSVFAIFFWLLASPALAVSVVTGSFTGNGADDRNITISPACQPKAVFLKRDTAGWDGLVFISSMSTNASGSFTGTTQGSANMIQQLNSDGFQVGSDSFANAAGVTHYYVALCDNGSNDIATGSYTGNAADDRDITISPAFSPELVIIIPADSSVTAWRGATSHSGDKTSFMNSPLADAANHIQSFGASGFQVGTAKNSNTVVYHYIALKASTNGVSTGSFAGDTNDNRNITTTFLPEFVIIKGDSATRQLGYRFATSGDLAFHDTDAAAANIIQAFTSTTFQVGTHTAANENTVTMRWAAIADVSGRRSSYPIMLGE